MVGFPIKIKLKNMALSINVLPLCVLNLIIGERNVSHLKNCIYILPKHIYM